MKNNTNIPDSSKEAVDKNLKDASSKVITNSSDKTFDRIADNNDNETAGRNKSYINNNNEVDPDDHLGIKKELEEDSSVENNTKVTFTMKDVFDYGKIIILALVIAFILNNYIVANAKIPTGSMENTVMPKDRVLGNRLSYLFEEPKRGDIIIFHYPDDESQEFLKRIIGLPGDIIDIVDGKVFINDSSVPLKENYIKDIPNGDFGPYKVPEDSYFMMGDNRDDSFDSRYWENTFVTRDEIVAKAFIKYYPSIKLLH